MESKAFYVYELVHNGTVFYVGKGKGKRIDNHAVNARYGYESHVCRRIRKIWEAGQDFDKRKVFETDNEKAALAEEIRLIAFYGRANLTNMTDGGEGTAGCKPSEEQRKRLSEVHMGNQHAKGFVRSAESRRVQSERNKGVGNPMYGIHLASKKKGKPISDEQKKKMSITLSGKKRKPRSDAFKEKQRINATGRRHTLETRKKLSESRKGKPSPSHLSEEGRKRIVAFHKGKVVSELTRQRISNARKRLFNGSNPNQYSLWD